MSAASTAESGITRSIMVVIHRHCATLVAAMKFYRTLAVRQDGSPPIAFARCHWGMAAVLFSLAACGQVMFVRDALGVSYRRTGLDEPELFWIILAPLAVIIYALIAVITRVIARRTHDGSGLSRTEVLRVLYLHSFHYVPVAFLAAFTVCGFIGLLNWEIIVLDETLWPVYYWILAGEAAISVVYLLITYRIAVWISMSRGGQ
jgi:hypothetical protein